MLVGGLPVAAEDEGQRTEPRAFWSGTISFGLVSIPVDLYPAVRPRQLSLRMLGPDGHPLTRRYYCSEDGEPLTRDELVRGFPSRDGEFIVVSDEELEELEPRKSRDIDLRRFVDRAEIDPRLFERPYVLAPAGQSTKAYHLLAQTMEHSGRAGIATFVMRGREYLAAIFAEGGLLRAETLRFSNELRTPEDVGLPEVQKAPAKRRRELEAALAKLDRDELDEDLLRDEDAARLRALAERKRAESRDVVEVSEALPEDEDEEPSNVVDIMSLLKQRLGAMRAGGRSAGEDTLDGQSKKQLLDRARKLDIRGRSSMSKQQLIKAIRAAG